MDGGNLVNALALIAAVVDPVWQAGSGTGEKIEKRPDSMKLFERR